jgi:exocyst complex component 2
MALATDRERQVLNHYRIATLYPERWPHQDNESSDDEDEDDQAKAAVVPTRQASKLSLNSRSSYSKYRNIDRHASIRSATTDSESLVQKDEPDALGMAPSVATQLKRRGVPIEQSDKIRK